MQDDGPEEPTVDGEVHAALERSDKPFPIVGIGASAGGLEAFQEIVARIDPRSEHAYVLVQHLDPDHESLLPELLAKRATVPVLSIIDGVDIEPGKVYLIPPGAALGIEGGRLRLSNFGVPRGQRRAIDGFFSSLAKAQGTRCACIVLSGTGSDGSVGVKAVKEAGGLVFVQDPREARYDGMPKAAIATDAVDLVLPVAEMISVVGESFSRRDGIEPILASDEEFLARVTRHVRYRTGHDFSGYKPSTLMRRVARRMSVLGHTNPGDYLKLLIASDREARQLQKDLLINVTSFFRDPRAFESLRENAIAPIVDGRGRGDEIRVWVPGCSSGQEAYSIAIVIAEELSRVNAAPQVSIFATDVDEDALNQARAAVYPNTVANEMPQHLLDRYFDSLPDGYRVIAPIREMVRVSRHNLIADAPYSKLDLISCRNVLIYFGNRLQEQIAPVFHYALKPDGFLLLGSSETPGSMMSAFEPIDRSERLYRRRRGPSRRLNLPLASVRSGDPGEDAPRSVGDAASPDAEEIASAVLARHAPAHVVIGQGRQVLFASARTGRFLELPTGQLRLDLLDMARPELRAQLRVLIMKGSEAPGEVTTRPFEGVIDGRPARLLLSHETLPGGRVLIVFQDRFDPRIAEAADADTDGTTLSDEDATIAYVHDLEQQLDSAQQTIRTTVEELETSNEELKSSNEEMMSMNEELQSANEELSTVNEELQNKIGELNQVNDDLQNLIDSIRIAILFLDSDLRVRSFTPETARYFRLVEHDKGRPLAHIQADIDAQALDTAIQEVLEDHRPREIELQATRTGDELLVRLQPYRTGMGSLAGIVVSFTQVTELRGYARELEAARAIATERLLEIEELYRLSPQAMGLIDRSLRYIRVNGRLAAINGRAIEDHVGRTIAEILPQLGPAVIEPVREVFETGVAIIGREIIGETDAEPGAAKSWEIDWYPVRRGGEIYAVGVTVRDVTKHKEMERQLRQLMLELQHRVKNMLGNVTSLINRARRERGDPARVLESLVNRVRALANTHNLLTAENWGPARLIDVLQPELVDVYGAERVVLRGPDVRLSARATLALGMAIHELATNAAKYGALSSETGRVQVRWSRVDDGDGDELVLRWEEEGGPEVTPPEDHGFGSDLIRATIEGSLQGRVTRTFEPSGVRCVVVIPFD